MENLSRIKIEGFKSIKKLDLEMKPINVLIGANGSGKSNFIGIFNFLKNTTKDNSEDIISYVEKHGGSDAFLFFGRNATQEINIELEIQRNLYTLKFDVNEFNDVLMLKKGHSTHSADLFGIFESSIKTIQTYDFQNVDKNAYFKRHQKIFDYDFLRFDAKNIAPFLYRLKQDFSQDYQQIVSTIQIIAPFFKDFILKPIGDNILLRWQHKNDINNVFSASQLSDGTARFICMATLFLQPKELRPATIVLDEPEIGLHPAALSMLVEIIKAVANDGSQVIISTQSVELANYFEADDFIVVDYEDGESKFKRLDKEKLEDWIENYQIGEAWSEGLLGGEPI